MNQKLGDASCVLEKQKRIFSHHCHHQQKGCDELPCSPDWENLQNFKMPNYWPQCVKMKTTTHPEQYRGNGENLEGNLQCLSDVWSIVYTDVCPTDTLMCVPQSVLTCVPQTLQVTLWWQAFLTAELQMPFKNAELPEIINVKENQLIHIKIIHK